MATYAIGDIQGCYDEFMGLLEQLNFSDADSLWLAGDLVNRGPQSLRVLRFIKSLGNRASVVLGNHDLHLLALHYGATLDKRNSTLQPILQADDREELMDWLRHRPMLVDSPEMGYVMTHAGIPHIWTLHKAKKRAAEVETILQSHLAGEFFRHMYGNKPDQWSKKIEGWSRLRLITNYFTRMRFITKEGRLEFSGNGGLSSAPKGFIPWYLAQREEPLERTQLFGHWAALGEIQHDRVIALDTGCVWGNKLTAFRLEDGALFSQSCDAYSRKPKTATLVN